MDSCMVYAIPCYYHELCQGKRDDEVSQNIFCDIRHHITERDNITL